MKYLIEFFCFCCLINILTPNAVKAADPKMVLYSPDNKIFDYSDYLFRDTVLSETDKDKKAVRFNRGIVLSGKGYGWDAPGARIRWRTNAKDIVVSVFYTDKHAPKRAHNSTGLYCIDEEINESHTFAPDKKIKRPAGKTSFKILPPNDNKQHTYELIMPYGDSVDFLGIEVNDGASFEAPQPRPSKRCLFYGDSVTHGFTASNILHTYPFQLTRKNGWQLLNMAIGGHSSSSAPADAKQFAKLKFDILVVALGVNDWQGKRPPEVYAKNMNKFLDDVRQNCPQTPVYMLSPLWVADAWGKKIKEKYSLDEYRNQLKQLVELRRKDDRNLHFIDGTKLIDHDESLFDRVLVHPNNKGFVQMSDRLSEIIK